MLAIPLESPIIIVVLAFVGAILSEKLRVSYTTVMIAIGLAISLAVSLTHVSNILGNVPLDQETILGLIVPPIIFEAAMRTRYEVFRAVRNLVIALAILGVVVSAIVAGYILNTAIGLPIVVALTFGVIVSPTDPVSVVETLKKISAPEKLVTILETEAYFNDATAVILFPIALSLAFTPLRSVNLLVFTFGGGIVIGLLVSGVAELLYRLIVEPLAETSFTIAIIFGSYALSAALGFSGLVSVAIAGLYMGNRTMRVAMSEDARITMTKFWEVVAFLVTSFAFLLIGLKSDVFLLVAYAPLIVAAFLVMLLARVLSVYSVVALTNLTGEKIPRVWTRILALGGLRGVVSAALALSLPDGFPFKNAIVAMTFGVALLSVILQSEVLRAFLKRQHL